MGGCVFVVQLHKGVQKCGLMGFCDPCPGEEKMLRVTYTWREKTYKVRGGNTSYVSHTQVKLVVCGGCHIDARQGCGGVFGGIAREGFEGCSYIGVSRVVVLI